MNDAAADKDAPGRVAAVDFERTILHECYHFGWDTEETHGARNVALRSINGPHVRVAEAHCRLDQRIEHRFQIEGRAADHLEDVGCGSLLLERLAQLVEQPRVLDGNDGLIGEISVQCDLLVGEGPNFLPKDGDNSNQLIVLEHRHTDGGPNTAKLYGIDGDWMAFRARDPLVQVAVAVFWKRVCSKQFRVPATT